MSAELDGYYSDTGISVAVGKVSPVATRLFETTKLAQQDAMTADQPGARLRDLGRAVEKRARRHGFRVIKNLNGHGLEGDFTKNRPYRVLTTATEWCFEKVWYSLSSRSYRSHRNMSSTTRMDGRCEHLTEVWLLSSSIQWW